MRFKKSLIMLLVGVLALTGLSVTASAQSSDYLEYLARFLNGQTVAGVRDADDTDVAIVVDYVEGANTIAQLALEANGDLTFTQDNTSGATASTELECPVSGALGGVISVSDGACNTFGEVVDIINASVSWRAVLVGALRTDTWDANSILADPADSDVRDLEGDSFYWDTDASFMASYVVSDKQDFTSFYGSAGNLLKNPWDGTRATIRYLAATSTFGSGSSTIVVYSVKPDNQGGSEEVTTLFSTVGASTTTEKIAVTLGMLGGILGRNDEKLLFRLENSAASASTFLKVYGSEFASR